MLPDRDPERRPLLERPEDVHVVHEVASRSNTQVQPRISAASEAKYKFSLFVFLDLTFFRAL